MPSIGRRTIILKLKVMQPHASVALLKSVDFGLTVRFVFISAGGVVDPSFLGDGVDGNSTAAVDQAVDALEVDILR